MFEPVFRIADALFVTSSKRPLRIGETAFAAVGGGGVFSGPL